MGCKSNIGGTISAISIAVIPNDHISHYTYIHCHDNMYSSQQQQLTELLYPPFFSTAATSGAILYNSSNGIMWSYLFNAHQ